MLSSSFFRWLNSLLIRNVRPRSRGGKTRSFTMRVSWLALMNYQIAPTVGCCCGECGQIWPKLRAYFGNDRILVGKASAQTRAESKSRWPSCLSACWATRLYAAMRNMYYARCTSRPWQWPRYQEVTLLPTAILTRRQHNHIDRIMARSSLRKGNKQRTIS